MSATPFVHVAADLAAAGPGDAVPLGEDEAHHLTRVLRLRTGAEVEVADGRGRQAVGVLDAGVVVLTAAPVATPRPRPELVLAQALPKGRKLDEVVRLATELGVDRVVPVVAARSVVTLTGERAERADVTIVPPEEVPSWRPEFEDKSVYLSVDIDAADPGVAPGTGTMEPFGLSSRAMARVVRAVAPHAVGVDVVEVNDRDDGQAAALGAKLLREFVFAHAAETA